MQRTIENVGGDPTKQLILFELRIYVKNVPLSIILVLRINSMKTRYREKARGLITRIEIKLSLAKLERLYFAVTLIEMSYFMKYKLLKISDIIRFHIARIYFN